MNPITVALGFVPSFYSWQIGDFEFHRGEFYWPQLQLLTSQFTQAMGDGNELTCLSIIRFDYKNVRHPQRGNWRSLKKLREINRIRYNSLCCETFSRNIFQVRIRLSFSSHCSKCTTVWKLRKFSLTLLWQKFRENNKKLDDLFHDIYFS